MNDKDKIIFRDEHYTLGVRDGKPYFSAGSMTYLLSCHPYEPCTYISRTNGELISVIRNAFDPSYVLEAFSAGESVTSITGRSYSPREFCVLLECAVRNYREADISGAESLAFPKPTAKHDSANADEAEPIHFDHPKVTLNSNMYEQTEDPFCDQIEKYPDLVIDYRLIKSKTPYMSESSHREALAAAMRSLSLSDSEGEPLWEYNISKAAAAEIGADELFAELSYQNTDQLNSADGGDIPYRRAFLYPPYGKVYSEDAFTVVNKALFPNGASDLRIYRWTTDWSDYFDDGHEWWGVLCVTVYDPTLDRYVVILASATD